MRPHTHLEQVLRFWLNGGDALSGPTTVAMNAAESADLVHRSVDRAGAVVVPVATRTAGNWLARWFDRLEARAWQREQRARDAYLGEATDVIDLEYRIRRYDQSVAAGRPAGSPGYYL